MDVGLGEGFDVKSRVPQEQDETRVQTRGTQQIWGRP